MIEPTDDNPLYVFIDGVQTIYKSAEKNDKNLTDVELYTGVKAGQVVSFAVTVSRFWMKNGKGRLFLGPEIYRARF